MRRNLFFVLLAAIALGAHSGASKGSPALLAGSFGPGFSAMPKGPTWTRPAPTTWSSKPTIRWEARFGEAVYIA
ncbi:MAG: hypothetical protein SFV32_13605 [Opitutaceae bacterium]|nr:hypothetical protein [Opitutaceae bacterium]